MNMGESSRAVRHASHNPSVSTSIAHTLASTAEAVFLAEEAPLEIARVSRAGREDEERLSSDMVVSDLQNENEMKGRGRYTLGCILATKSSRNNKCKGKIAQSRSRHNTLSA